MSLVEDCQFHIFFRNRHFTTIPKWLAKGHWLPLVLRSRNRLDVEVAKFVEKHPPEDAALYICAVVYVCENGRLDACMEGLRLYQDVADGLSGNLDLQNTIRHEVCQAVYMMAYARRADDKMPWDQRAKRYMRNIPDDLPLKDRLNLATSLIWVAYGEAYDANGSVLCGNCEWLAIWYAARSMMAIVDSSRKQEGKPPLFKGD